MTALARIATRSAALLLAFVACNGMVGPSVGSETNWVGSCVSDSDCASLQCVCGLCTRHCDTMAACPGAPGLQVCATPESPAFASTCGEGQPRPSGVCLRSCAADDDCLGAYRCEAGACVPLAVPGPAASSQATAALLEESVGAPCIPQTERFPNFQGYQTNETDIDDHAAQCATRVCMVVNFRGRSTCTYGQSADPNDLRSADPCRVPGTGEPVTVPVEPQVASRRTEDAVYCSCRCDGPDGTGPFCACPTGFECAHIFPAGVVPSAREDLLGSYCIKAGTAVTDPYALDQEPACSVETLNCGPPP
jgi:hypothetical protein